MWDRNNPDDSAILEPLEPDVYIGEITDASLGPSPFKDKDGNDQERITVIWRPVDYPDRKLFSGFAPYFGFVSSGAPSKWMEFTTSLIDQGLVPEKGTLDDLIGIKQKLSVIIKNSPNKNGVMVPKNAIAAILPLRPSAKQPAAQPQPKSDTPATPAAKPKSNDKTAKSKTTPADVDAADDLPW